MLGGWESSRQMEIGKPKAEARAELWERKRRRRKQELPRKREGDGGHQEGALERELTQISDLLLFTPGERLDLSTPGSVGMEAGEESCPVPSGLRTETTSFFPFPRKPREAC